MKPKLLKLETLHKGWSTFSRATLQTGGEPFTREIEDHGRAVSVLPYNPEMRTAILVRLLRAPALVAAGEESLLEAPAGLTDGEEPADAARREVMEEAGIRLGALEHVATVWTMPGISTERMDFYLARFALADRIGKGGGLASENEDIIVEEHSLAELWSCVERGEMADLKTLTLLMALKHRHPELFD
jgi:nudix-type nucleoside diphosphatase (YffH/AdpP family)